MRCFEGRAQDACSPQSGITCPIKQPKVAFGIDWGRGCLVEHRFGGRHTDDKLERLRQYLTAFATALKNKGFVRVYVDAFAGSGDRAQTLPALPLLGDRDTEPVVLTVPGSARLALNIQPALDIVVLIERDPTRFEALEKLRLEHSNRNICCHAGDANTAIRRLCETLPWQGSAAVPRGMRAVIFLDPYGMEVDWETVKAIAATQAVDLWYFFPLMGIYRQAARDAVDIDEKKRAELNRVLGTTDWEDAWYKSGNSQSDLFDNTTSRLRIADVTAIEAYVKKRLQTVFKGVVLDPLRIKNARGAPLACMFFSVATPKNRAVKVATEN